MTRCVQPGFLFPLDDVEGWCWVAEQVLYQGQARTLSFTSGIGSILPLESSFWAAAGSVPWPSEQDPAPEKTKILVNNLYHFASCSQHLICLLKLKNYNCTWCSILSGQLSLGMAMCFSWLGLASVFICSLQKLISFKLLWNVHSCSQLPCTVPVQNNGKSAGELMAVQISGSSRLETINC